MPIGGSGQGQVYVRCSDINVICESRKVPAGEPHDVFIKVRLLTTAKLTLTAG